MPKSSFAQRNNTADVFFEIQMAKKSINTQENDHLKNLKVHLIFPTGDNLVKINSIIFGM